MNSLSGSKSSYKSTTFNVDVIVFPCYDADNSYPENQHFVWSYHIVIKNHNEHPIQLMSRYWRIIDDQAQINEVMGEGVVGRQPEIPPQGEYEYCSEAHLKTPSGFMHGTYHMVNMTTSETFSVDIPEFSLDSPYLLCTSIH